MPTAINGCAKTGGDRSECDQRCEMPLRSFGDSSSLQLRQNTEFSDGCPHLCYRITSSLFSPVTTTTSLAFFIPVFIGCGLRTLGRSFESARAASIITSNLLSRHSHPQSLTNNKGSALPRRRKA